MNKILLVAETRDGAVREVTYELLGAASRLALGAEARVVAAVVDQRAGELAAELDRGGADEVIAVPIGLDHFDPGVHQKALATLIDEERPTLVLVAHSVDSFGFAPAVAAAEGLGFASDVVEVSLEPELSAVRGAYGEKLTAELRFPGRETVLLMLRPGTFAPAEAPTAVAEVRASGQIEAEPAVEHIAFREPRSGGVDITKADFVLAIGRGVEQEDAVERFAGLAEELGAVLAASRPLVDAGWCDPARQVGQSGRTVKPSVYLAMGISGAVQHLAGMRDAGTVIAINTDPDAPIFGVADYGAVVDLFELADELERTVG